MHAFRTKRLDSVYPNLALGLAFIKGCQFHDKSSPEFKLFKRNSARAIRDNEQIIRRNFDIYTDYFMKAAGIEFPLARHFEKTLKQGLPNINNYIDCHINTEMHHGVLMGIQDYDRFKGNLYFDVSKQGESFDGIRGAVICSEGEIVVRDDESIVASLLQGPDNKTQTTNNTINILIYSFQVPGVDISDIQKSLSQSVEILTEFAGATSFETIII